jgi:hypothetical protein
MTALGFFAMRQLLFGLIAAGVPFRFEILD